MKRLLSIIGAISLVGTSTTSLVACKTEDQLWLEKLKKEKEENKIKTNNKEIRDNLEWISAQEKPFNTVDNKYYYVVWCNNKINNWKLTIFQNNQYLSSNKPKITIDFYNEYELNLEISSIGININIYKSGIGGFFHWWYKSVDYIKSVYRWNLDTKEPDLIIDDKGKLKVNKKEI
ncbi:lipoprotein [Spiroplasma endosymbiont of Stenodema calcarata]|uniref:lipoprotein n=1 Tax=Spiroplasma endosymbiont of Stenodema calcarata TaxID=3139328 RepID=UPI003CCB1BE1